MASASITVVKNYSQVGYLLLLALQQNTTQIPNNRMCLISQAFQKLGIMK